MITQPEPTSSGDEAEPPYLAVCPKCDERTEDGACYNRLCDAGRRNIADDRGDYLYHLHRGG